MITSWPSLIRVTLELLYFLLFIGRQACPAARVLSCLGLLLSSVWFYLVVFNSIFMSG